MPSFATEKKGKNYKQKITGKNKEKRKEKKEF